MTEKRSKLKEKIFLKEVRKKQTLVIYKWCELWHFIMLAFHFQISWYIKILLLNRVCYSRHIFMHLQFALSKFHPPPPCHKFLQFNCCRLCKLLWHHRHSWHSLELIWLNTFDTVIIYVCHITFISYIN